MARALTEEELQTYHDDGAVLIRQACAPTWVDRLTEVVERQLARPSDWANDQPSEDGSERFFTDRYQWRNNPDIYAFISESGIGDLAAQAMQCSQARFYFDHMLVKEPGTRTPTPWHQDAPYWPVRGRQICSLWLALTPCDADGSALEFIRASHRGEKYYLPVSFGDPEKNPNTWADSAIDGEPCPDIEADRSAFDIISYAVEAGDALLFSAYTLHGARGNKSHDQRRIAFSTRWLGDDVTWDPRQGTDPTVGQQDVCIQPGEPVAADPDRFPALGRA